MTIITTALRLSDAVADSLGLLDGPLDADPLIQIARKQTGLSDFGDTAFIDPLTRLLEACSRESALGIVGRSATKWDIVRFLSNLLLIQDAATQCPEMTDEPIRQPIFITGLPRSGTTFLHRLMLTDPPNRAPTVWETIYPSPIAGTRDQRIARVARQLRAFEWLAPEFRALHPMEATSPQECSEITAHVFRSLRFDTNYHIPSYRNWLDADVVRNLPGYRFHQRFLQFLQFQDRTRPRWVLKCPEHLFALHAIRSVYPDARLVFVHRDPVKVLLSQAKLTEVLRRPFTHRLDPRTLGPDESRRWLDGTQRMMTVGDDAGFPEPVCHVHHMDLISDPIHTVETVYQHFGLTSTPAMAAAIRTYVTAKPRGGYGEHSYRFEDHGLDEQAERAKFRPYMVRFGVTAETAPTRPPILLPQPASSAGEPTLLS
ncbi:sulfotransferase [Acidisphaera sp. S103]|uniref:sulfotransferase family protein n=1 Tax=Acidisphaera sp. S103 TaxID=1747223 RepID=UPI00131B1517|nr:sulfotransferase [Acidisphaera sp. S103]